jgi:Ca2+-binding EF-hand superfamily protein
MHLRGGALALLLFFGLAPFAGWAVAQQSTTLTPDLKARFQQLDKNGDGRIDREEFHQAAVDSFYFRDKGKKGYLTVEDLQEASPEAFKAANRKRDGRLTLQEYVNALFRDFEAADVDRDGGLTYEEFEAYVRRARP